MRPVFRIVCLIIGLLAFIYALDELARFIFDTGEGNFLRLIVLAAISAAAFIALILQYNVETYPERLKEERPRRT